MADTVSHMHAHGVSVVDEAQDDLLSQNHISTDVSLKVMKTDLAMRLVVLAVQTLPEFAPTLCWHHNTGKVCQDESQVGVVLTPFSNAATSRHRGWSRLEHRPQRQIREH